MARNRKASIKLNNREYFIRPGSYRREIAPTTIPKFSTGDIGYSDLTAWQFWAQSDWGGGGLKRFSVQGNEYLFGHGIDTFSRYGKIQMAPILSAITCGTVNGNFINDFPNDNSYPYALTVSSGASGVSAQYHQLCELTGGNLRWHKNDYNYIPGASIYDISHSILIGQQWWFNGRKKLIGSSVISPPSTYELFGNIVRLQRDIYAYAVDNVSSTAVLYKYSIDDSAWSVAASGVLPTVGEQGNVQLCILNNKVYVLCALEDGTTKVFAYDTVTMMEVFTIPASLGLLVNLVTHWATEWNGYIYVTLRDLASGETFIYKFNELSVQRLYRSLDNDIQVNSGKIWSTPQGVFVGCQLSEDTQESIAIILADDSIHPYIYTIGPTVEAGLHSVGRGPEGWNYLFLAGGGSYDNGWVNLGAPKYKQSAHTDVLSDLISSIIDFDLFNVDKYFGGLTVYHEPLPSGCSITLSIKIDAADAWTVIGSNSIADSVSFDVQLLTGNIGKKIQYKIEFLSDGTATPVVEDIVIRYILQPKTKRKWAFDLLLANNIEEYAVKRSASDLDKELWATIQGGVQKFTDVDGKVYDASKSGTLDRGVLITDCKQVGPYPFGDDGPEFIAQVELQEG